MLTFVFSPILLTLHRPTETGIALLIFRDGMMIFDQSIPILYTASSVVNTAYLVIRQMLVMLFSLASASW